jgi:hypothetical protein
MLLLQAAYTGLSGGDPDSYSWFVATEFPGQWYKALSEWRWPAVHVWDCRGTYCTESL